jgi:hypothetical protein
MNTIIMNHFGTQVCQSVPSSSSTTLHSPVGTEENHEKLDHDIRSESLDLNSQPPKYEAGMITNLSLRSVAYTGITVRLLGTILYLFLPPVKKEL